MDYKEEKTSITEIIRKVGYKKWIEKRHLKLPETTKLIDQKMETLEDFMIRKIEQVKDEYIKKGRVPTRLKFMTTASVRNATTKNSLRIQNVIDRALAEISEKAIMNQ